MEVVLVLVGVAVGTLSGFFGIGGGMILVPILMLLGIDIKTAIGISIVQMVFSSFYGSYLNHRRGSLVLGEGIWVGVGGFVGGFIGVYLSMAISSRTLEYLFMGLLIFALYRLFSAKPKDDGSVKTLHVGVLFFVGMMIGIFAISLGVGGSIMLTPILVGFLHYPIKKAVSAGLFFVAFSSIAGLTSHLSVGTVDLEKGIFVAVASLFGVYMGVWLKEHVSDSKHKLYLLIMYGVALSILIKKIFLG
ncbi:sulfite exporter TauE/SafE family protein [Sulfurovum sp. bin170]|uniref:sulfite exporter TauE/SafE family protein n=1 Tax=Sulfurovum sp. bin170 TaxID=2695268 RepID=UPI0013E0D109|nr:sulfite exporter TauE/SafE family protein [Sulfurovum sp. bin170]NEW59777.1 sulfite exporter TauE/SafE family protein [Sulfurovum sp. bin170]